MADKNNEELWPEEARTLLNDPLFVLETQPAQVTKEVEEVIFAIGLM